MLLEHAQVPAMPAGVENTAGELKQEGGQAITSQRCSPRGVVGESCPFSVPSGFSTWSKSFHRCGALWPMCTGRGLGSGVSHAALAGNP